MTSSILKKAYCLLLSKSRISVSNTSWAEETILPNAVPITIPTAMSMTLPLTANFLTPFYHGVQIIFDPFAV